MFSLFSRTYTHIFSIGGSNSIKFKNTIDADEFIKAIREYHTKQVNILAPQPKLT